VPKASKADRRRRMIRMNDGGGAGRKEIRRVGGAPRRANAKRLSPERARSCFGALSDVRIYGGSRAKHLLLVFVSLAGDIATAFAGSPRQKWPSEEQIILGGGWA